MSDGGIQKDPGGWNLASTDSIGPQNRHSDPKGMGAGHAGDIDRPSNTTVSYPIPNTEKPFPHPTHEPMDDWLRMRYVRLQIEALVLCSRDFRQSRAKLLYNDIQDLLDDGKA